MSYRIKDSGRRQGFKGWEEDKHPRDHGRFSASEGAGRETGPDEMRMLINSVGGPDKAVLMVRRAARAAGIDLSKTPAKTLIHSAAGSGFFTNTTASAATDAAFMRFVGGVLRSRNR